jgi:hypothetical protein
VNDRRGRLIGRVECLLVLLPFPIIIWGADELRRLVQRTRISSRHR